MTDPLAAIGAMDAATLRIGVLDCVREVCRLTGAEPRMVRNARYARHARERQIATFLASRCTRFSVNSIAAALRCDPSTARHAVARIDLLRTTDPATARLVTEAAGNLLHDALMRTDLFATDPEETLP
jgi:chromosomal replication initiation ATPase DnaA